MDLLKLIFPQMSQSKKDYNSMSDEELEEVKQKLLKELKESSSVGGKVKLQNKV